MSLHFKVSFSPCSKQMNVCQNCSVPDNTTEQIIYNDQVPKYLLFCEHFTSVEQVGSTWARMILAEAVALKIVANYEYKTFILLREHYDIC